MLESKQNQPPTHMYWTFNCKYITLLLLTVKLNKKALTFELCEPKQGVEYVIYLHVKQLKPLRTTLLGNWRQIWTRPWSIDLLFTFFFSENILALYL